MAHKTSINCGASGGHKPPVVVAVSLSFISTAVQSVASKVITYWNDSRVNCHFFVFPLYVKVIKHKQFIQSDRHKNHYFFRNTHSLSSSSSCINHCH